MFEVYFLLGFQHILDIEAYDHMLFLLVLLAGINYPYWKSALWLITGFTIGHAATLAITVLQQPLLPGPMVEFLIPVTILLTAAWNLLKTGGNAQPKVAVSILFGLIHGMGFAGYLTSLLTDTSDVWVALISFNLGVELGQLLFALVVLCSFLLLARFASKRAVQIAQTGLSLVGLVISLFLAASNWQSL